MIRKSDDKLHTKTIKSEKTRALILGTAVSMFRENGYESTTMRGIALQCGVSLGNAYYYFRSKEHLVLGLYQQTLEEQLDRCQPVLSQEHGLKRRLHGVLQAQIAALQPYRDVLTSLFKFCADPASPLSPFSDESAQIRQQEQKLFSLVLSGSKESLAADLLEDLPYCLWLLHMSIVLFWLHDRSSQQEKTHRLIGHSCDLIVGIITIASLPGFGTLRKTLLNFIKDFRLDRQQ